jgi:hypothetical protein
MSARVGAGFFSNAWGYLPWGLDSVPADVIELRRVER